MITKLTDFSRTEINAIDYILYLSFEYQSGMHNYAATAENYYSKINKTNVGKKKYKNFKLLVQFLIDDNYLKGKVNAYNISSKGKILCNQAGGIIPIFEKGINEKKISKRFIISALLSLLAIGLSIVALFK